jgi:hypothetical protein
MVGLLMVSTGAFLGLPIWALFAIYPLAGTLTLLLAAMIAAIREDRHAYARNVPAPAQR